MREERRKGILEGLEQGLQRGLDLEKIAIIQGMLVKGYGWNVIEDITHLDEAAFCALKEKYEQIEN